jgi:hypothetical protein
VGVQLGAVGLDEPAEVVLGLRGGGHRVCASDWHRPGNWSLACKASGP